MNYRNLIVPLNSETDYSGPGRTYVSSILDNQRFLEAYHRLSAVTLNPRRHTASDAKDHSESVAHLAAKLGEANSCSADELRLLADLGRAHDIGKITGTARPE